MFKFPPANHPAIEHFDYATIGGLLNPANIAKMPTRFEAKKQASDLFKSDKAMRSITCVVLSPNDDRLLLQINRRGGTNIVWNFGAGLARAAC